ncbi:nitroreductase family protein [Roseateles sp.]|jgi:SagB-type dehydrogenase family enzyme|uniref:nitroreductase family protein n=1 Tax=Roseateles sp. TaxID=1971397 RepID=UPI0037C8B308
MTNMLTKLVLGAMGALRPEPAKGSGASTVVLPPPLRTGGMPLMQALQHRQSVRSYRTEALPIQQLSDLLWAANGQNRPGGGRTAPSALNAQEVDIIVALPQGAYRFDPARHQLELLCAADLRRISGYQDFVDSAPLDLIFVADHGRMKMVPAAQRSAYAHVAAGAIAQNIYLYAASVGLATVIRAWLDRAAMANALGLAHDHEVLLSQTVGHAAAA